MKKLGWYLAPCVLMVAACGGSTTGGDTGVLDSRSESGLNDVTPNDGADVAPDASTDVADLDGDGLHDVAGDVAPDAGITGTWRVVQFSTAVDSVIVTLTDTDAPLAVLDASGVTGRANGLLTLEPTQFTLAFGVIVDDHFTVTSTAADSISAFGAEGFSLPGLLSGTNFTATGSTTPAAFTANSDGTLSYTVPSTGAQFKFVRAGTLPTASTISVTGQGTVFNPSGAPIPISHPRVAIAWDQMGGASHTVDNDQVPTTTSSTTGTYMFAETGMPPASATIDGTTVGLGFTVVYDDVNDNMVYDSGTDAIYGLSPVAIAFRSGTPSSTFMSSAFRYLNDGYQYVYVNYSGGAATLGLPPFDPTHSVPPDVTIQVTPFTSGIPHLLP